MSEETATTHESVNENETVNTTTGELAVRNPERFSDEQLAQVTDLNSLGVLLSAAGVSELEDVADYGSGFVLLDSKDPLIGKPFAIVEWRWNRSDKYDQEFASIALVTTQGEKFIINDGSVTAGVAAQLRAVQAKRIANGNVDNSQRGLLVKHGLSRSEYPEKGVKGEPDYRPAGTTYFLATSPVKR